MRFSLVFLACAAVADPAPAGTDLRGAIDAVRRVGPDGEGSAAAARARRRLAATDRAELPALLAGMDGASPFARNWLRSAVNRVVEQAAAAKQPLPAAALDTFLRDRKHNPPARRLVAAVPRHFVPDALRGETASVVPGEGSRSRYPPACAACASRAHRSQNVRTPDRLPGTRRGASPVARPRQS
jgi:hypothetical protein